MNLTLTAERYGFKQGERAALECLLLDKFATIPEFYQQQIAQAETDVLLNWLRRTLHSDTLEEVFKV